MYSSLILALSNLFGIPCLHKAQEKNESCSLAIIYAIIFSSTLMHLTESKHNYRPVIFASSSTMFLNIDRVVAIIGLVYFFPIYWKADRKTERLINILAIFGLSSLYLGEQKSQDLFFNTYIYPFLHLIWHGCVYTGIYYLI